MSPALRQVSDPGGRQLLVTGRVADAISGRGIAAEIALDYDAAGDGGFRPLPAELARRADGWFAFHLAPRHLPPPTGAAPALRLTITAPGHAGAVRTIAVAPVELALEEATRTVAGHPVTLQRIVGAPFRQSAQLSPHAVALDVVVLEAADPASPIAGATVEMLTLPGGSQVTGSDGGCRFSPLPVVAAVEFRVTRGQQVTQHRVRPAFDRPLNRAVFAVPA